MFCISVPLLATAADAVLANVPCASVQKSVLDATPNLVEPSFHQVVRPVALFSHFVPNLSLRFASVSIGKPSFSSSSLQAARFFFLSRLVRQYMNVILIVVSISETSKGLTRPQDEKSWRIGGRWRRATETCRQPNSITSAFEDFENRAGSNSVSVGFHDHFPLRVFIFLNVLLLLPNSHSSFDYRFWLDYERAVTLARILSLPHGHGSVVRRNTIPLIAQ